MPRSAQDFNIRGGRSKETNLPDQNAQRLEQTAHALTTKTGFSITPAVTLSFVNGTRTFTITPDGSTFEFWVQGVKYTKTVAESVVITDTEGLWFIYYIEGGILTASQTRWVERDGDKAFVVTVHWDATNNTAISIGYECHSHDMPPGTHAYLHDTIGTNYKDGLGLIEGAGGDAGKVGITEGEVHDESIEIIITDGAGGSLFEQVLTLPAQIPVYYRSGATAWRKYTANDYPWYDNSGGDRIHYNKLNGTWASAEATNPYYVAYWIFGTNDIAEPIIAIMGQREDLRLADALDNNQIENLSFGTLPFSEMKVLFRLIWKSSTAPDVADDIQDLRSVSNIPGGTYVPTPTPNLDQVCSVGAEYDGAVSEATAMKVGDGTDYLQLYTSGGETYIKRISGFKLFLQSDDASWTILQIDDDGSNFGQLGFHKTDHYTRLYSTGPILLTPSGDASNYLEFYTDAGIPRIKIIGGYITYIESDNVDNAALVIRDDASHYVRLLYSKSSHYAQLRSYGGYLIIRSSNDIRFQANGDTDDYLTMSMDGNTINLTATGASIVYKAGSVMSLRPTGELRLQPNNDSSDYFQISTTSNIPKMKAVGACHFYLDVDTTSQNFSFLFGGSAYYILSGTALYANRTGLDLGLNSATTWDVVYYHSLSDKTCASFVGYSDIELYNILKTIQPRTDGLLHHDKNSKEESYFPHIDMITIPDEFAVIADEDYILKNVPKKVLGVIENTGEISFKKGDKCGINFNTMVYALNELVVLQYGKIQNLENRILQLEK